MVENTAAPMKVKPRLIDSSARAVRIDAVEHRDGGAERRDLRQRQIHEDHAALHHVDAQIGMNAGQNQARDEGSQQKRKSVHD